MERLLIRVPLLLVEWLNPVGPGAMVLLYHKKPHEGSFLFTVDTMVSNIRLRPGGVPIDEHYAWQVRTLIIPQKTASQFWAGSLVRVPPLALTLIVTYFN